MDGNLRKAIEQALQIHNARGLIVGDNAQQTNHYQITVTLPNGEQRAVPFLAPARPDEACFVGRDELLNTLKTRLFGRQDVALLTLPGVGKTELALKLAYDPEVLENFPDGILWTGLGRHPNILALLGRWASALGIPPDEIARLSANAEPAKALHDLAEAVSDKIGMQRMLLVADDAWSTRDARAFELGGPQCAHLVTTRRSDVADDLAGAGSIMVEELSEAQGLLLLEKLVPEVVSADPDAARELVQATGGLPLSLVLMGSHLRRAGRNRPARRIRSAIEQLHQAEERLRLGREQSPLDHHPSLAADIPMSLAAAIGISEEALKGAPWQTLVALSIFRPKPYSFTEEAALAVTEAPTETLDTLLDYGLLEYAENGRYRIHRAIAEYARMQLPGATAEELHTRAVAYFSEWLQNYENEQRDAASYLRWYRYENPEWQETMAEWLYHLAHTPDRAEAGRALAQAYLDAFWWWGCYTDYPFCRQLLTQWAQTQTAPEDQEWLRWLRQFHESYPPASERSVKRGDWGRVEEALLGLRRLGKLDGDVLSLPDQGQRHLRAITDLFLAESFRFRQVNDPRAEQYYQEALRLFSESEDDDDAWNRPWTLFHLGDLYRERGQLDAARQKSQESLALAQAPDIDPTEFDCEIIANDYRLSGDVCWQQGNSGEAFQNYAWAVFYAYAFHAIPKSPPDFYTVAFYAEITERTLTRLQELWQAGEQAEARKQADYLREFWTPYWKRVGEPPAPAAIETLLAENRPGELAAALFPAAPKAEDSDDPNALYVSRVKDIFNEMQPQEDASV